MLQRLQLEIFVDNSLTIDGIKLEDNNTCFPKKFHFWNINQRCN